MAVSRQSQGVPTTAAIHRLCFEGTKSKHFGRDSACVATVSWVHSIHISHVAGFVHRNHRGVSCSAPSCHLATCASPAARVASCAQPLVAAACVCERHPSTQEDLWMVGAGGGRIHALQRSQSPSPSRLDRRKGALRPGRTRARARAGIAFLWLRLGARFSRPGSPTRVLSSRALVCVQVASYYPKPEPIMKHPLVRQHLHEEWFEEKEARRKLGKGPPKKGQGKRASRKK